MSRVIECATFVADITKTHADAELELKPLFTFEADPREGVQSQLTSLDYAASLGGFLVATASEDSDNAFHGNTLWFVADGETQHARKLATFEVAMKCEGLAVLNSQTAGGETTLKLLLTFDNDPHATKIPSRYQTAPPDPHTLSAPARRRSPTKQTCSEKGAGLFALSAR